MDWANATSLAHVAEQHDIILHQMRVALIVFTKYSWMLTVALGIPGNILTILISLQKDNRRVSTCLYMAAVALADLVVLLEAAHGYPLVYWTDGRPSELSSQLFWYHSYTFAMLSGCCLAQMSIDRLLVVRFPLAASSLCTTYRAKLTIAMTYFLGMSANLHIFFIYKYTAEDDQILQVVVPTQTLKNLVLAFHMGFGNVIPFIVIVFCNVWITITLQRASRQRKDVLTSGIGDSREKESKYLTRMLILVSVAYVILSVPYRLYDLVLVIPEIWKLYKFEEPYWRLRYDLQYLGLIHLWYMNHMVNFYLYMIGGGKKCRNDVRQIFSAICCKRKRL